MKARLTIDFLDPMPNGEFPPQIVMEFDHLDISQRREMERVLDEDGKTTQFVPGETTTTIVGTRE